jgi:hypothetical protein
VIVQKSCWEKPPELPLSPEQLTDEITGDEILQLATSFVLLVNYVADQQEICGEKTPSDGP